MSAWASDPVYEIYPAYRGIASCFRVSELTAGAIL